MHAGGAVALLAALLGVAWVLRRRAHAQARAQCSSSDSNKDSDKIPSAADAGFDKYIDVEGLDGNYTTSSNSKNSDGIDSDRTVTDPAAGEAVRLDCIGAAEGLDPHGSDPDDIATDGSVAPNGEGSLAPALVDVLPEDACGFMIPVTPSVLQADVCLQLQLGTDVEVSKQGQPMKDALVHNRPHCM